MIEYCGKGFSCGCSGRYQRALQPHGVVVKQHMEKQTLVTVLLTVFGIVNCVLAFVSGRLMGTKGGGRDWPDVVCTGAEWGMGGFILFMSILLLAFTWVVAVLSTLVVLAICVTAAVALAWLVGFWLTRSQ